VEAAEIVDRMTKKKRGPLHLRAEVNPSFILIEVREDNPKGRISASASITGKGRGESLRDFAGRAAEDVNREDSESRKEGQWTSSTCEKGKKGLRERESPAMIRRHERPPKPGKGGERGKGYLLMNRWSISH